jgi:hypothetical protein
MPSTQTSAKAASVKSLTVSGAVLKLGTQPCDKTGIDLSAVEIAQRTPGETYVPKFRFLIGDKSLVQALSKGDRAVLSGTLGEGDGWDSPFTIERIERVEPGQPMDLVNEAKIVGKRVGLDRKNIGDEEDYLYDLKIDVEGTTVCVKVRGKLRDIAEQTEDGQTLQITAVLKPRTYRGKELFSLKAIKILVIS